jgi:FkbM family methyltransferase
MHSQWDEEKYILAAFSGKKDGHFLDIGAWHPVTFSNTRALFENGWSGVMVEPSPTPLLNLLAEYGDSPKVQIIAGAIGFDTHCHPIKISDDCLSSSNGENIAKWDSVAKWRGELWYPTITPTELWTQFGNFDFINLDVEGFSADLFLHMMKIQWFVRCFCVEHDGRLPEIAEQASANGYVITYANSTNAVFVR